MNTLFATTISSFNMQGGGLPPKDGLADLLSRNSPNILFLQETVSLSDEPLGSAPPEKPSGFLTGELCRIGALSFQCVISEYDPATLAHLRSTSVLVEEALLPLTANWGWAPVSGTSSHTCWVDLSCGLRIASLYPAAQQPQAAAEVSSCLRFLEGTSEEWLLLGNYRMDPDLLQTGRPMAEDSCFAFCGPEQHFKPSRLLRSRIKDEAGRLPGYPDLIQLDVKF